MSVGFDLVPVFIRDCDKALQIILKNYFFFCHYLLQALTVSVTDQDFRMLSDVET